MEVASREFFLAQFFDFSGGTRLFPQDLKLLLSAVDPDDPVGFGKRRRFLDPLQQYFVFCHLHIVFSFANVLTDYVITQNSDSLYLHFHGVAGEHRTHTGRRAGRYHVSGLQSHGSGDKFHKFRDFRHKQGTV
ncbi:hypothetical protein SDC9_108386 [bioreactor metagenome]|uniref:Uncharacterized protein n=1 Tax=bioreactor metagenome TaxID=1076179 RepID=A0A645B8Z3_9ZZZZ